ncbi:hypothetical protein RD792_011675 [Penstemon davidsonii]|uniref:Alpha-carbonic anhydrase domain-containing protein n=1 Tax=Penstemon davidsonii TaxID=160366 RepID=A0ABR0CVP2_9LAMI|nr:hypothetical protein RD792_011675 [Penstemon davidsonii]
MDTVQSARPVSEQGEDPLYESAAEREELFNRVAHLYDKSIDFVTLGLHRLWKRWSVSWSGVKEGDTVLDACCGSGDITFLLSEKVGFNGKVIGLDFSKEFLEISASRQRQRNKECYKNIEFAAELHLVHIADDGSVSVIAILFDYGRPDPLVAKIQNKLNELEYKVKRHEEAPVTVGPFHPEELRKRTHKYYRYVGSFSTPPCTENVIWSILGKVRSISREQVKALKAPLDMRCKNNNRPCQPLNGRHVELYQAEPTAKKN